MPIQNNITLKIQSQGPKRRAEESHLICNGSIVKQKGHQVPSQMSLHQEISSLLILEHCSFNKGKLADLTKCRPPLLSEVFPEKQGNLYEYIQE